MAERQAGAGESSKVSVTREMVTAGRSVLWESGRVEIASPGSDDLLVKDIYTAMCRAAAGCGRKPLDQT